MRILLIILRKEFLQIFRNKMMLPIIFIMPFVQTLVLVYAATLDLQHTNITIVDLDHSQMSEKLCSKFDASSFFDVNFGQCDYDNLDKMLLTETTKAVLIIPHNFENDMRTGIKTQLQLNINAIDGQTAGLINIYVNQTILSLLKELKPFVNKTDLMVMPASIQAKPRFWYNETLNYKHFMLPGILTILISMIGIFLTSLNLVREKEMGTIEQINVTPIKKWQFLSGKLIPFWLIGLFDLALGILIGVILFDLPIEGSILSLFIFSGLYLFTAIGLGLLISDFADTQQQAMFTIFFFFLIFVLMGGVFTSVESMPVWAQYINKINPLYYFMKIIRAILLKGSGIKDMMNEFFALLVYGIIAMSVAVWQYRKTN
ncbi:MAG: ABC transporter permease [Bacteroidales bacterium]|nr:ABC transporter permease [Bacteroidales bacterium]MDD4217513.1 ABC transporter permease [Bacteroidales bacterium]MDY0142479.1 ABC transporter permease [Bacteroidales bacterium]